MTHTKLRLALQEKYGKRCYRITRGDEVHIYGYAPNSNVMCWWLMGDIDSAYLWMNL